MKFKDEHAHTKEMLCRQRIGSLKIQKTNTGTEENREKNQRGQDQKCSAHGKMETYNETDQNCSGKEIDVRFPKRIVLAQVKLKDEIAQIMA